MRAILFQDRRAKVDKLALMLCTENFAHYLFVDKGKIKKNYLAENLKGIVSSGNFESRKLDFGTLWIWKKSILLKLYYIHNLKKVLFW